MSAQLSLFSAPPSSSALFWVVPGTPRWFSLAFALVNFFRVSVRALPPVSVAEYALGQGVLLPPAASSARLRPVRPARLAGLLPAVASPSGAPAFAPPALRGLRRGRRWPSPSPRPFYQVLVTRNIALYQPDLAPVARRLVRVAPPPPTPPAPLIPGQDHGQRYLAAITHPVKDWGQELARAMAAEAASDQTPIQPAPGDPFASRPAAPPARYTEQPVKWSGRPVDSARILIGTSQPQVGQVTAVRIRADQSARNGGGGQGYHWELLVKPAVGMSQYLIAADMTYDWDANGATPAQRGQIVRYSLWIENGHRQENRIGQVIWQEAQSVALTDSLSSTRINVVGKKSIQCFLG